MSIIHKLTNHHCIANVRNIAIHVNNEEIVFNEKLSTNPDGITLIHNIVLRRS